MAKDELRNLLQEKKVREGSGGPDWDRKRARWVRAVQQLFRTIQEDYLADLIAEGLVEPEVRVTKLIEENVGPYEIQELVLKAGREEVVLSPKGLRIAGAQGRVDIAGETGDATLVRFPGRWSFIASRVPTLRTVDLTKQSFREMLQGIMRR